MAALARLKPILVAKENIPNLADVAPEVVRLRKARDELREEVRGLIQRSARSVEQVSQHEPPKVQRPRLSEMARKLAKRLGETVPEEDELVAEEPDRVLQIRELNQLAVELDRRIADARMLATDAIRGVIEPLHAAVAKVLSRAVLELARAQLGYTRFLEELVQKDLAPSTLSVLHYGFMGDPRDHASAFGRLLRDAIRGGYIPAADVPEELR